jgi:hypothetical protein
LTEASLEEVVEVEEAAPVDAYWIAETSLV